MHALGSYRTPASKPGSAAVESMQEQHGQSSLRPGFLVGWPSIGLPIDRVRGRAEEKTTQPFPVPFSLQPRHVLPVQRMSELLRIPLAAPLLSLSHLAPPRASCASLPLLSWRSWTRRCVPVRTFCETVGREVEVCLRRVQVDSEFPVCSCRCLGFWSECLFYSLFCDALRCGILAGSPGIVIGAQAFFFATTTLCITCACIAYVITVKNVNKTFFCGRPIKLAAECS
jgi:hypothetical protein